MRFARRLPSRRRREAGRGRDRGAPHVASGEVSHAPHPRSQARLRRFSQVPEVCIVSAAARVAAALGARAEEVCRRYLPQGRKQGRYWTAGDVYGARGRSLFVRLAPPGVPGKWTDASSDEHGDLLDIIRHRICAPTLRAALDEARAFLARSAAPAAGSGDTYDATEAARRLWRRCRAIDGTHAEAYLHARGLARCRFPALRYHPALLYRDGGGVRRLPALVAAVTAHDGDIVTGVHRTWLDPQRPAKAILSSPRKALGRVHGHAVRFGDPGAGTLLVGEGIETVLSVVTAIPDTVAAAALSAGSLGAFAPPAGVTRLVIARDNDAEGERAALRLAQRCARAGIATTVISPRGEDFNDDLLAFGPAALAAWTAAALAEREPG